MQAYRKLTMQTLHASQRPNSNRHSIFMHLEEACRRFSGNSVTFRQACVGEWTDLFLGGIGRQYSAYRGAADPEPAGDLGFADAGAV